MVNGDLSKALSVKSVVVASVIFLALIVTGCQEVGPPAVEGRFPLVEHWHFEADSPIVETPIVGDNKLVIPTARRLYALDISTGSLLWSTPVPPVVPPSPLLVGQGVVVVGQREGVIALDEETGRMLWTAPNTGCNDTYFDVVPAAISGEMVYVIREGCSISAYDLQDGAIRWQVVVSGGRWVATLFVDGTELYLAVTGEPLQIRDAEGGTLLHEAEVRIGGGAAYYEGILYTFDREEHLVAFDVRARQVLWTGPRVSVIFSFPPLVIGRYVLTPICDGHPAAYDVETGELLWTAVDVVRDTYQTPVVIGNMAYIRGISTGKVYALTLSSGVPLGCLSTEGRRIGLDRAAENRPVVTNGLLIIPVDRRVYAYGP